MDSLKRLALAKEYKAARGIKVTPQLFQIGTIVRIAEDLGTSMQHFIGKGKEAVVEYTYGQEYGGGDFKNYSLILLDENSIPYNSCAWYREDQLTLVDDNIEAGLLLIEGFNNE